MTFLMTMPQAAGKNLSELGAAETIKVDKDFKKLPWIPSVGSC